MEEYFLMLRSDPSDESFIGTVNKYVEGLAAILRSVFLYRYSENRSESVITHYWREQVDNGVTVALTDDLEMPGRYLYVAGGDPRQRERVWKNLRVMLPLIPIEELTALARDPDKDPGALQRLAISLNGTFSQESFDLIVQALGSVNLEVRMSAAAAAILLKWPQFIPVLEAALSRETTEEGKRVLDRVLERCNEAAKHG